MFDWFWRIFYELDKDLVKEHQVEKAKLWKKQQTYLKTKKIDKIPPASFSRVSIENGIKESIKGKQQLCSYKEALVKKYETRSALKNEIKKKSSSISI